MRMVATRLSLQPVYWLQSPRSDDDREPENGVHTSTYEYECYGSANSHRDYRVRLERKCQPIVGTHLIRREKRANEPLGFQGDILNTINIAAADVAVDPRMPLTVPGQERPVN